MKKIIFLTTVLSALFLINCIPAHAQNFDAYSKAVDAYYKDNFSDAVKFYNQYLKDNPDDKVLHDLVLYNLGNSYVKLNNKNKAISTFKKLIAEYKDSTWVEYAKDEIQELSKK